MTVVCERGHWVSITSSQFCVDGNGLHCYIFYCLLLEVLDEDKIREFIDGRTVVSG